MLTDLVQRLAFSYQIIALDESGRVAQQGDFKTLSSINGYVRKLLVKGTIEATQPGSSTNEVEHSIGLTVASTNLESADDIARQTGDFSLYKYYLKFAGVHTMYFAFGVLAVYSFCLVFPSRFSPLTV